MNRCHMHRGKHFLENNNKIKFKKSKLLIMLIIIFFFILNINNMMAYFTDEATISNQFTIANNYTVTFDANNGTGNTKLQHIFYNTETNLTKNTFTRTGYSFFGWNTAPDGTGTAYTDEQAVTDLDDTTLYAQWSYTIKFEPNDGTGTMDDQIINDNRATKLSKNDFSRTSYIFYGWNTAPDGTGKSYDDEQSIKDIGNTTLYAQWLSDSCIVKFDANGGNGTMPDQEMTYNVAANLSINKFTHPDYQFTGWNTKADGSGTYYTDGQLITIKSGITLYAQWRDVIAEIDGTYYKTLQEAVKAVPKDNTKTTVKLLSNTSESVEIFNNQNIVFNFQDYTISNNGSKQVLINRGTIEISNGTIRSSAGFAAIDNYRKINYEWR